MDPDQIVSGAPARRLGDASPPRLHGVRVVLDARPLQGPDRAPLAAAYLEGLLDAYDADPLPGESFAFLIGSDEDDVTGGTGTSRSSAGASSHRRACSGPRP